MSCSEDDTASRGLAEGQAMERSLAPVRDCSAGHGWTQASERGLL